MWFSIKIKFIHCKRIRTYERALICTFENSCPKYIELYLTYVFVLLFLRYQVSLSHALYEMFHQEPLPASSSLFKTEFSKV